MWGVYGIRYTVYGIWYTVYSTYGKEAMPKVTLYIREDDYDKWKLIKNKSELVSQAINSSIPFNKLDTKEISSNIRPATYLEEAGYVDKKDVENIIIPDDPKIRVQSTPKNNSVGKPTKKNICPEHLVDKDICRLMKHK